MSGRSVVLQQIEQQLLLVLQLLVRREEVQSGVGVWLHHAAELQLLTAHRHILHTAQLTEPNNVQVLDICTARMQVYKH